MLHLKSTDTQVIKYISSSTLMNTLIMEICSIFVIKSDTILKQKLLHHCIIIIVMQINIPFIQEYWYNWGNIKDYLHRFDQLISQRVAECRYTWLYVHIQYNVHVYLCVSLRHSTIFSKAVSYLPSCIDWEDWGDVSEDFVL